MKPAPKQALHTLLLALLLLGLAATGCAHRDVAPNTTSTLTVGMSYDQARSLIKKHSGTDITSGLALMPLGRKPALTALYWRFQDYDAVLGLFAQDKVITGMTYWTKADFGHSKAHRAQTEQNITTLRFNPATKEVSIDKTIVRPVTSPSFKRITNPTNTTTTASTTTNTVSPEFIAQNENAFE